MPLECHVDHTSNEMATATRKTRKPKIWTEEEYLHWPEMRLIEFDHGSVEELPGPTVRHQIIVGNLSMAMYQFVHNHRLGSVLHAPLPVKTGPRRYREPDVMFRDSSAPKVDPRTTYFWDHVSFVAEVLADELSERDRDLIDKRIEYAEAGISEYWLVDPEPKEVTVLRLQGCEYAESGTFGIQDLVRSSAVPGFEIPVAKIFAK